MYFVDAVNGMWEAAIRRDLPPMAYFAYNVYVGPAPSDLQASEPLKVPEGFSLGRVQEQDVALVSESNGSYCAPSPPSSASARSMCVTILDVDSLSFGD